MIRSGCEFATVLDEKPPLEHHIFADGEDALLSAMWVDTFDPKADFRKVTVLTIDRAAWTQRN